MKINIDTNISTSEESIDANNELKTIKRTLEQEEELAKTMEILNNIKNILSKNKSTKQKEDNVYDELYQYLKNEKIDITKIKDVDNYSIIQRFCLDNEDYYLRCIFYYLDKELDENEFLDYLLENENISGMNVFEISSEIGEIKIFRILKKYLEKNIKLLKILINDYKDGKKNIFHISASNNKIISLLFFYSFYYNNNIHVSILDIKNKSSHTPLHIACRYGFYYLVKYLVDMGANMNSIDKENKTPLFYAVKSKNLQIVKFLIISGADKNIKDINGMKAINYTEERNILDVLEDKSYFDIICRCKIQFITIKNNHRNIAMIVLLIFFIIFHGYIAIKYKLTDFLTNCNYNINLTIDYVLLIINIIFQFFSLFIYFYFQIIKTKKENNNNNKNINKFSIKENGIEYYEMFKYNENLCVPCRRVKELSTKHCIACDVCVDQFDHHCFFLNTCITRKHLTCFKIFIYEITFTLFLNLTTSIIFFIDMYKEPKIYYGLFLDDCNFSQDEYKFVDYIVFIIDAIYFIFCLFTILISAVPFIINKVKKKKEKNKVNLQEKINSPLLPIEENNT